MAKNILFSIIHVVWQQLSKTLYSTLKTDHSLYLFFKFWPFTFRSLAPKAFTLHFRQKNIVRSGK